MRNRVHIFNFHPGSVLHALLPFDHTQSAKRKKTHQTEIKKKSSIRWFSSKHTQNEQGERQPLILSLTHYNPIRARRSTALHCANRNMFIEFFAPNAALKNETNKTMERSRATNKNTNRNSYHFELGVLYLYLLYRRNASYFFVCVCCFVFFLSTRNFVGQTIAFVCIRASTVLFFVPYSRSHSHRLCLTFNECAQVSMLMHIASTTFFAFCFVACHFAAECGDRAATQA